MDGSHKLETKIVDIAPEDIDPKIYDLYDEYCHGTMERREFLRRAASMTVVGSVSALAMAQALLPRRGRGRAGGLVSHSCSARSPWPVTTNTDGASQLLSWKPPALCSAGAMRPSA